MNASLPRWIVTGGASGKERIILARSADEAIEIHDAEHGDFDPAGMVSPSDGDAKILPFKRSVR